MVLTFDLGAPYSPELQGVAERVNRSVWETARRMLKDAKLPDDLWAEACSAAAYIKNRSHSGLKDCTPEQMWMGKRPDIRNFKVFGCNCMVHIPDARRRKWDPKSELYMFLGYGDTYSCYHVLHKNIQVHIARNVVFFEDSTSVDDTEKNVHIDSVVPVLERETAPGEVDSQGENSDDDVNNPNVIVQAKASDEMHAERRYSLKDRRTREFPDFVSFFSPVGNANDPLTPKEALSRMDRDRGQEAMQAELQSFQEYGAWSVVPCKWGFKLKKELTDGVPDHYKAQLVAKGFTQTYGENYDETFGPVVSKETIRMLFGFAAEFNRRVEHLDVKTAFLNGRLKETVYMKLPESVECENAENKVVLLHKVLYDLKQASHTWNKTVHDTLVKLGLKQLDYEPSVYFKRKKGDLLIIALYVGDFLVMSNNERISLSLRGS
jgi:hypothetical protein